MKTVDAHRLWSRVEFECPACRCRLERRVSRGERALVLCGALALGTASILSLLARVELLRPLSFTTVLYLVTIGIGVVEVRNEIVRRRFHVA